MCERTMWEGNNFSYFQHGQWSFAIRVLYHSLRCVFSDGVPDAGGILQDGTRVRWLAHVACMSEE